MAVLRLDAVASVALAAAGFVFTPWLEDAMGLPERWPIRVTAGFLAVYGFEQWLIARRPTRRGVMWLVAIDGVFALAMLVPAVADPTGADTWLRWALVGLGLILAAFGVIKTRLSGLTDEIEADEPSTLTSSVKEER